MEKIYINKEIAQLIILQRVELIGPILKKIRKIFGREFFTNIASKYLVIPSLIGKKYLGMMEFEYKQISKYIELKDKEVLSIGSGVCGLELIIYLNYPNNFFSIIEKNYISKKVTYGWDTQNFEAYNNLELVNNFLIKNGMDKKNFMIYNYDLGNLPQKNFDLILSLYSLDYHYDFSLYESYIKKVSNKNTKIIFDTIRPDYFKKIFDNVEIIYSKENTVHKSKRILCSNFKN